MKKLLTMPLQGVTIDNRKIDMEFDKTEVAPMPVKEKILTVLEERGSRGITGKELAASVGMTKNTVWKAVKELREDGYAIFAMANKGYCLNSENDILSEKSIHQYLKTVSYGRSMDVFKTIDSTSNFAKSLARLGMPDGTTVIADFQTNGRGRTDTAFYSPGNTGIYMSVIVRPKISVDYSLMLTSCAATAVAESIEALAGIHPEIEWINDIMLNGKKVGGILTEPRINIDEGGLDYAVIGIGINVLTENFPKDIRDGATSIFLETGRDISRVKLVADILNRMESKINGIQDKSIAEDYKKYSAFIGKDVTVRRAGEVYSATVLNLDEFGRLVIESEDDELIALTSGEVTLLD